jgi:hypothetical protein
MRDKREAARALGGAAGGYAAQREREGLLCDATLCHPKDTTVSPVEQKPVALRIFKRGRPCIVAKLVPLDGQPVLAVCWRHQRGTRQAVSVPLSALAYAEAHGARRFVLRDDRTHTMRCIDLADMRRLGWLGADGEIYVKLADMVPCPWRTWPFAERVISLDEGSEGQGESEATQLALALEGGVS